MRCPKCGYTSFDNLERCKRCKKNIAATAAALMGTTVDAVPPAFLCVGDEGEAIGASAPAQSGGANVSLKNKSPAVVVPPGEKVATSGDEPALPETGATGGQGTALDLSGMDISDLKAPAPEVQAASAPVDDFSLEDLQLGAEELGVTAKSPPKPTPSSTSAAPPNKVSPAGKTGTALDSFNFDDLDELLVADEKA